MASEAAGRPLWRHTDFLRLWGGESVSLVGVQLTTLTLPLMAATTLGASPLEMGALGATQTAAALVVGPLAGAFADRRARRPMLIGANVARAVALGGVPLAALLGLLSIPLLCVVALVAGGAGVVFVIAYQAYLPTLIPPSRLLEGNGKLRFSEALAQVGGPGLAGGLVQILGAPAVLLVSAVTPLVSVLAIATIRTREVTTVAPNNHGIAAAIAGGFRAIAADLRLRAAIMAAMVAAGCESAILALAVLFATGPLRLTPAALGLALALAGPGALGGAALAGIVVRRFGAGTTLALAFTISALAALLLPGSRLLALGSMSLVVLWRGIGGFASAIAAVTTLTVIQTFTPTAIRGRANALLRVAVWGAQAVGALLGGILGQTLGLSAALLCAAVGIFLAPIIVARSPLLQVDQF